MANQSAAIASVALLAVVPAAHRWPRARRSPPPTGAPFVLYAVAGGRYFHDRLVVVPTAAGRHVDAVQQLDRSHAMVTLGWRAEHDSLAVERLWAFAWA